jgi:peptidyl-dipeptidase Dcp
MNKLGTVIVLIAFIILQSCDRKMTENPLLLPSNNQYGAPAFDKIKIFHFKPAFETAIAASKARIDSIINNPDAPTFANTVEALEFASRDLSILHPFFLCLKRLKYRLIHAKGCA